MGALWKPHCIVTPAGTIGQITERSYDPGIQPILLKGDGRVTPHMAARMLQQQSMSFSTEAVKTVLDRLGLKFYAFNAAVDVYRAQIAQGGSIASGSSHSKLSGSKGCIVPVELSATQGGVATLSCMLYWISSDGTVEPVARSLNVPLPVLSTSEAYTLGPAKINGNPLTELTRLSIRFNYATVLKAYDGDDFPRFAYYDTFTPEISISTEDPSQVEGLGLGGVAQGGTASVFYLRRKTAGGGNVANATASHIKITVADGYFRPDPAGDVDGNPSTADLVAHPTDPSGSNNPTTVLAINTASAIS